MRLFVAIDPNVKVIASLTELVRRLAPLAPMRWVHPGNMHVTLKYIGEWEEGRLDDVVGALSQVRVAGRIKVSLAGLEFFPRYPAPRVFWVPVERTPALRQLKSSVDRELMKVGIPGDVSPYAPHLTLGRLRKGCDLTEMREAMEELPSREFGTLEPDSFAIYGSKVTPQGAVYSKIEEFPFLMRFPARQPASLARHL